MRSPDRTLRPLLRALLPPIDRSRLRFRGGWVTVPIFLLIAILYPISLDQADWVDTKKQFVWIAVAAVALGTLVGNGRIPPRAAALLGALGGTVAVLLGTILATGGGTPHDRATANGIHVNNWVTQVLAGEAANDPTVFVLVLGATAWCSAYVGAFILARERRPWEALILCGGCLVINVSLALTSLLFDLVLFSLAALVLLTRLHTVALQERWERRNIVPAGEMDWRLLRGGLTWTTVLVIMALLTPRVAAAEAFSTAFTTLEGPYHRVEAEWQRFFAGVSGPSRLQGVSFSDAIRLGQAPNLGDRVVMTVDAESGHFWRAVSYDFYTGAGWRTTETDRQEKISVTALERTRLDATFDIAVPHANLLFGANEPTKADVPYQFQTGEDRSYSTSLRAVNRGQAAGTYTVSSLVSRATKDQLRRATTLYPAYIRAKYLQLPSSLPQRVRDKAHQIADTKVTAYDKAEAIEAHLRATYKYSTVVKSVPPGRDPVDYFLFDLKEDFCEYFASSMAVLLREEGVPARVVEGFTSGVFDPAQGKFVVREVNAHAWVEAYFPQYGWIEFEPTPSELPFARTETAAVPAGSAGGEHGPGTGGDRPDREGLRINDSDPSGAGLDAQAPGALTRGVAPVDPRPALAIIALFLIAMLALFARFEWRFRGLDAVDAAWGKTRLLGAYAGHAARASQTPYEYAASLGAAVPEVSLPLRTIAEARVRDRYAPGGASVAERAAAASAWRQVARVLLGLLPTRIVRAIARLVR